jgi:hypothetical protein
MKKYLLMGFFVFFTIAIFTIAIRSAQATDIQRATSALHYPTINPTEYVRKLTEAPMRRLTEIARKPSLKPTINPTEYIRRLTGVPEQHTTPVLTKKPTVNPTDYAREYSHKLSGTPPVKPSMNPTSYIRMLSGTPERKPLASPSGTINDKHEENKKKLADEKLKICLAKSEEMKKRSEYLVNSVTEIEKKFTSILTGVENYYKEKLVPAGITLSNYDVLVADIAAREKAVTPLLEKAQTDVVNFSCTGDDPHGQLKQLDTDVRAVLKALQEYRTGIHNLMTALKELKIVEPSVVPSGTQAVTQ